MFDRMLMKNNLRAKLFEHHRLNEQDLEFIRECIDGPRGEIAVNNMQRFDNIYRLQADDDHRTNIWRYKGRGVEKSFLYDIVSNKLNGFDVDKFDYLLRDSMQTGVAISFNKVSFPFFCKNHVHEKCFILVWSRSINSICSSTRRSGIWSSSNMLCKKGQDPLT
jgi:HD superfamily phosphohydrolase